MLIVVYFIENIEIRTRLDFCNLFSESASGMLVDISIENCTNFDECNIITKREYTVQVDFIPSKSSTC